MNDYAISQLKAAYLSLSCSEVGFIGPGDEDSLVKVREAKSKVFSLIAEVKND